MRSIDLARRPALGEGGSGLAVAERDGTPVLQ